MLRRLGPTSVVAAAALAAPPLGSIVLFLYISAVGEWLRSHGLQGVALYAFAFMVLTGLALLPTYATAMLGGWAFGFAWGFPAALAGFLGGAGIGYAVARRASGDRVMAILREHPTWAAVRDALVDSGFWRTALLVALVRLPPNSPFAITNLVMASVKVRLLPYSLGTLLGMAPRTALAIFIAAGLRDQLDPAEAAKSQPWWLFAGGVVLGIAVLVVVGSIANKAVRRVTQAPPAAA